MRLTLNSLDVDCVIGERLDERIRLQRLIIDAELEIDTPAITTDDLHDTVDYAALSSRIRSTLKKAKCQMIERAAYLAATECLASPRVKFVRVRVTKQGAIPHLASCSAIYEASKAPKPQKLAPCSAAAAPSAAVPLPVPREASGDVSRSLLLGSELNSKNSKPPKPVLPPNHE